jgi:hypothetical protein
LGEREGQDETKIEDDENGFEKPSRDQLPDTKPGIEDQRRAK